MQSAIISPNLVEDLLGETDRRRWNPAHDWVISKAAVHSALVREAGFIAAQAVRTTPQPRDGSVRRYVLSGLKSAANAVG